MVDNYGDRGSPIRRLMPLMNVLTSPQLRSSKYHGEFVPLQRSGNGGSRCWRWRVAFQQWWYHGRPMPYGPMCWGRIIQSRLSCPNDVAQSSFGLRWLAEPSGPLPTWFPLPQGKLHHGSNLDAFREHRYLYIFHLPLFRALSATLSFFVANAMFDAPLRGCSSPCLWL